MSCSIPTLEAKTITDRAQIPGPRCPSGLDNFAHRNSRFGDTMRYTRLPRRHGSTQVNRGVTASYHGIVNGQRDRRRIATIPHPASHHCTLSNLRPEKSQSRTGFPSFTRRA